jgi:carboxyl-terminal processing protease
MNRRFIFGLVITVLVLNLAIGAQVYLMAAGTQKDGRAAEDAEMQIFSQVLDQVHDEYVDGKDATYQQLIHTALKGMVKQLDPHSEFLDASSYHRLQDDTEGQFGGLGLVVGSRDGFVTVITPMDDTPGSRAGILAGDRIVKVNGTSVEKAALDEVVAKLRGAPDTQVTVSIERPSTGVTKDYTLTRAVIQLPMIKDLNGKKEFPVDGNKIGYVRITQFGDGTSDELEEALQKLQGQGMRGLIIDLRWNPGGLLDEAVGVCQKFLPRDTLIVSTEGRHTIEKYFAKGGGDELKGMPIVIIANLGSASAAEIVTGCLQDLHRAVVLGEKTFGKGSVQTIFPLSDGSALKLTVAKYYTPSHKVIHEHGITPDVAVPVTDFEEAALMMQRSPGGIESLPDKVQPEVRAVHDTQLERAEDLMKGLLIYSSLNPVPEKVAAK